MQSEQCSSLHGSTDHLEFTEAFARTLYPLSYFLCIKTLCKYVKLTQLYIEISCDLHITQCIR